MAGQLISAEDMRRAVTADPQFQVPRHPLLPASLVRVDLPDGILMEGAPTRQVLRGGATRDLVPAVLPLLDGARTVADVAQESGLPLPHVERVVALLYTCGLLVEGSKDSTAELASAPALEQLAYWSRNLDSTRVNVRASQAVARVAAARVAVTGDLDLAELLLGELSDLGASGALLAEPEQVRQRLAGTDLVIATITGGDGVPDGIAELAEECARSRIPFLPVRLSEDVLELGPYLDPDFTAGFDEAERQRRAAPATDEPAQLERGLRLRLAAGLTAGQVSALLSRVGSVPVLRGLMRVDLVRWEHSLHVVAPIPDTPPGPRVTTTRAGVPLAVAFETSVGFTPRRLLNPRAHQVHYKPGNLALQHEFKRWPSARQLPLGAGAAPTGPLPAAEDFLDGTRFTGTVRVDHLGTLLQRGAGRRPGPNPERKVQRWAPNGGNLGSVQLHVLARSVEGLESGRWGYVSGEHRLAHLGADTELGWGDEETRSAPLAIVLTANLARVASKYYGFGWRVVHLDAGVAIAQMAYTAGCLGLTARPLDRWDDEHLADLFDLDLENEPVTGVLVVRPGTDGGK
jgi:SagB-type dehydrogenase family enzyme